MTGRRDSRREGAGEDPAYCRGRKTAWWRLGRRHGDAAVRVFLDETDPKEKFELLRHILMCPECGTDFEAVRAVWKRSGDILKTIEQDGPLPVDAAPRLKALAGDEIKKLMSLRRTGKRSAFGPRYILGGAAGVLLIVVAALLLRNPFSRYGLQERTSSGRDFIVFEPWDVTRQRPLVFRWKSFAQVDHYELEILDPGLTTVFSQGGITSSSYSLPEEVRGRLQKRQTYFWKVTAYLGSGQSIESEFGKFILPEP